MLPKLKVKNQSIMHDYLFGSAKKAAVKGKTYKWLIYYGFCICIIEYKLKYMC